MDPTDNLAQSFLIGLVFCSLISDVYIGVNSFINNDELKKNITYVNDVIHAVSSFSLNKYEELNDGSICISNEKEQINNDKKKINKEKINKENDSVKQDEKLNNIEIVNNTENNDNDNESSFSKEDSLKLKKHKKKENDFENQIEKNYYDDSVSQSNLSVQSAKNDEDNVSTKSLRFGDLENRLDDSESIRSDKNKKNKKDDDVSLTHNSAQSARKDENNNHHVYNKESKSEELKYLDERHQNINQEELKKMRKSEKKKEKENTTILKKKYKKEN